jgi:hypothetical protein
MSEPLPPVLRPVIATLAQRAVDEYLASVRQSNQELADQRTNPVPLPAADKAA